MTTNIRWTVRFLLGVLGVFVALRGDLVQGALPDSLWMSNWIGIIVALFVCWAIMERTCRFLVQNQSRELAQFLAMFVTVFLYFDALGTMMRWYQDYYLYDHVVHFFGGASLAVWNYGWLPVIARRYKQSVPAAWIGIAAVGIAAIFGVLFEVFELGIDSVFGERYWFGDSIDTISDVSLGILGAIVAVGSAVILRISPPYSDRKYISTN